jgi:hypothetical protein
MATVDPTLLDGVVGGVVLYRKAPTPEQVAAFNECLSHQSLLRPSTWKIRKKCIDDFRAATGG